MLSSDLTGESRIISVEDGDDLDEEDDEQLPRNNEPNGEQEEEDDDDVEEIIELGHRNDKSLTSDVPDVMQLPGFVHEDQTLKGDVDQDDEDVEITAKVKGKRPIRSPEKLAAVRKDAEMSFGFDDEPDTDSKVEKESSHSSRRGGKSPRDGGDAAESTLEPPKRKGRPPKSKDVEIISDETPRKAKVNQKDNSKEEAEQNKSASKNTKVDDDEGDDDDGENEEEKFSSRRRAKPPKRYGDESPVPSKPEKSKTPGKSKSKSDDESDAVTPKTPKKNEETPVHTGKRGRPKKHDSDPEPPRKRGRPRKVETEDDDEEKTKRQTPKLSATAQPRKTPTLKDDGSESPKKKLGKGRDDDDKDEEPVVTPRRGRPPKNSKLTDSAKNQTTTKKPIHVEEIDDDEEEEEMEDEDDDEEDDDLEDLEDDEDYSPNKGGRKGRPSMSPRSGRKRPRSQSEVILLFKKNFRTEECFDVADHCCLPQIWFNLKNVKNTGQTHFSFTN